MPGFVRANQPGPRGFGKAWDLPAWERGERGQAVQAGRRTPKTLRMEARPHTLTDRLSPPLLSPREIEFLKKETAQRRVLEESELARKEEMDKLLDKVGPEVPWGQEGAAGRPPSRPPCGSWRERGESCCWLLRAQGHLPSQGRGAAEGAGPTPRSPRPDPLSSLLFRSQNWKATCRH